MVTAEAGVVGEIVDAARYPLADPGGAEWERIVSAVRGQLRGAGCSVLPGFVRRSLAGRLEAEGASVADQAYYDVETVNVYNTVVDDSLPADHPGRITMRRGNAFVPRDRIPAGLLIHRLYTDSLFRRFLAACFELPELYELADPLAGLCLNVVRPGMEHPWHFDTNEFTVSLLTRRADDGGDFEYCPNIRSAGSERFGDVRSVLTGGGRNLVRRLSLRPGDLQLFKGRYALHRVTRVGGAAARHSAIFAYCERPGVLGSAERTRQLFGRVLPEHHAQGQRAVRGDRLLD